MRIAKTLIRLGGFPVWSESSLGAHAILLVLLWFGSITSSEGGQSALRTVWSGFSQFVKQCQWTAINLTRLCGRQFSRDVTIFYVADQVERKIGLLVCVKGQESHQSWQPLYYIILGTTCSKIRLLRPPLGEGWVGRRGRGGGNFLYIA